MSKVFSLNMMLLLNAEDAFQELNNYKVPERQMRELKRKYKYETQVKILDSWIPTMSYLPKEEWALEDQKEYNRLKQKDKEYKNKREEFIIDYLYTYGGYEEAYKYCYNNSLLDKLDEKFPCGAGDRQCSFLCPLYKEGEPCNYNIPMKTLLDELTAQDEL